MTALVALAMIVSACSTIDKPAPAVRTVVIERDIPAEAKKPCDDPVILPDRRLSDPETQTYWGKDRTALRICEARRAAGAGGGNVQ